MLKKIFKTLVIRPNIWYDSLDEPWRFVFFLVCLAGPLWLLPLWLNMNVLAVIGACVLLGWRFSYRIWSKSTEG